MLNIGFKYVSNIKGYIFIFLIGENILIVIFIMTEPNFDNFEFERTDKDIEG